MGEDFIDGHPSALILGDNIFCGEGLTRKMLQAVQQNIGATLFAYYVNDPWNYGVLELDSNRTPVSIEEKPSNPRSSYAVTGLYFYDSNVCQYARPIKPSARGDLEITDINRIYLEQGRINVKLMGRGFAWMGAGTHDSFLEASNFVATLERRQGLKIACPEEIAFRQGLIDEDQLIKISSKLGHNGYRQYLLRLADPDNKYISSED